LLTATAALGCGFGAGVMALNTLAEEFFPAGSDRAVLAMNVLLGTGTALAPLLVAAFVRLGAWWMLPLAVALMLAVVLWLARRASLSAAASPGGRSAAAGDLAPRDDVLRGLPARFRLYAATALLYGVVETLNGNWSVLYLMHQRGVTATWASLALAAFWTMVTAGRLLIALLSTRVPSRWLYPAASASTLLTLLIVSGVRTAAAGVAAFGAAGLACAAILPLSISFGGEEFSRAKTVVSGELIAFYQVGYGVAAFGVGPLQDAAGILLSTVYAWASVMAAAMASLAFLVVRRPGTGPPP
jgi:fucose permease